MVFGVLTFSTAVTPPHLRYPPHHHHLPSYLHRIFIGNQWRIVIIPLPPCRCHCRFCSRSSGRFSDVAKGQVIWIWHDVPRDEDDRVLIPKHNYACPAMPRPQTAFLRRGRDASHRTKAAAPTARLIDVARSSHESFGGIGIALASGSKTSVLPQDCGISSRQSAKAVSPETEPGPAPLLPPPAVNLDTFTCLTEIIVT